MSLSVSSAATTAAQPDRSQFKARKEAFDSLSSALGSGDLAGAQQAFGSLQQASNGKTPKGPMGADLSAVQKALDSGDLAGAQSAFAKLQSDMQAARASHGGRRHDADGDTDGAGSENAAAQATETGAAQTSASGSVDIRV